MKTTLLAILASAGLAYAELSPEDFNQFQIAAGKYNGVYFAGVSHIGDRWLYRFNNARNEPIAFVPMEVGNFEQAYAAFIASMGTLILCKQQWKEPLDQILQREHPGWEIEWTE